MIPLLSLGLGVTAGLHGALYGAWKDSPYESFRPTRFVRELVIASAVALWLGVAAGVENPLILILSTFAVTRMTTELYKLFLRHEPQSGFRIPTQVHWLKHVVASEPVRWLMGAGWVAAAYGIYCLLKLLPEDLTPRLAGLIAGLAFGTSVAIAGAYKDGLIEGFYLRKFVKSPLMGAVGGLIVSFHTTELPFLALGAIALERMFNELFFKLLRPGYMPGKFLAVVCFPVWMAERRWLLVPYTLTWVIILYCALPYTAGDWSEVREWLSWRLS